MATKASRVPLIKLLSTRAYAAAASPAAACNAVEYKMTTLPNKVTVASCANSPNCGIVRLAVAFRAGSKYEEPHNQGASFVVRQSASLSTKSFSQFGIVRRLQQAGATLTATSDREALIYHLDTTPDHLQQLMPILASVVSEHEFRHWELSDQIPAMKFELANVPPMAKLLDMLQRAAFRRGLGNTIFAKDFYLKELDSETLLHYVVHKFTADRTAVTGVGICHDDLVAFANSINVCVGSGMSSGVSSQYQGGELRKERPENITMVGIAGEGCGLTKKDIYAFEVLKHALGGNPAVKRGVGSSPLSKAMDCVSGLAVARAINISHSGAGLFGVVIMADSDNIGSAVKNTMEVLCKDLSDADVARGKAQLTQELLQGEESSEVISRDLTHQALLVGSVRPAAEHIAAIQNVSKSTVLDALKRVRTSPKTMASIGRLHNVPYIDQL